MSFNLPQAISAYGGDAVLAVDLTRDGHGVSSFTVARWRRRQAFPPADMYAPLCRRLGCTPAQLGEAAVAYHLPSGPSAPSPGTEPVLAAPLPARSGGLGSEGGAS